MTQQTQRRTPQVDSTPTVAMLVELIFAMFGFFGVGWLYIGQFGVFFAMLIGFWVLIGVEVALTLATFGCIACIAYPLNIAFAVISAIRLRDYATNNQSRGDVVYLVIMLVLVLVVLCMGAVVLLGVGGSVLQSIPTPQFRP